MAGWKLSPYLMKVEERHLSSGGWTQKDKLVLEFLAVATAQAQQLIVLGSSVCDVQNMTSPTHSPNCSAPAQADNNTTIPWSCLSTTGGWETATGQPEDPWILLRAKPKAQASPIPHIEPADIGLLLAGVNTIASSVTTLNNLGRSSMKLESFYSLLPWCQSARHYKVPDIIKSHPEVENIIIHVCTSNILKQQFKLFKHDFPSPV